MGANTDPNKKKDRNPKKEENLAPQWKPGQSGNPNGRPKVPPEIKERALKNAPAMLDVWLNIAKNGEAKDSDRIKAAENVWFVAFGKFVQQADVEITQRPISIDSAFIEPSK